jgi:hypothetical protein
MTFTDSSFLQIRELRIIYKNWNDLPHTLFNEILPKGHDLSEIILHCLAKLSCKVNSAVALSYFRDEITRRSQHQPTNAKSHILTPDDVFKTLQRHGILPSGEGNGNTQKQADRRPLPLQGRLPSTMDVRPEKYTVLPGGGTHQQSRTSQGTTAVKNSQSQMGQAWNRSSNQSPAAPNPPATAARISSFATNSDSQSHKFKDNQPPQKRKDISVVIESNASKRPKPNQNPSPKYAP